MSDRQTRLRELQAQITALHNEEAAEQEAARKTVTPQYLFTCVPVTKTWQLDKMYDPSCLFYRIEGTVLNSAECKKVGHHLFEGGMDWVFNKLSGRLVCGSGGGSTFTSSPECYEEISAWIVLSPAGGDITEIMERHRSKAVSK